MQGPGQQRPDEELVYTIPKRMWPAYFTHPNVHITIMAGDSLTPHAPRSDKEVLIVRDAWYPRDPEASIAALKAQQDPQFDRVYYLSNTEEMHRIRLAHGFNSHFINIGCFIDDSIFKPSDVPCKKKYDAVMNARFVSAANAPGVELKRHYLTGKIERLALLDARVDKKDVDYKKKYTSRANCAYFNKLKLPPRKVAQVLRQSWVGLALSEVEGVSRASSEYLLTGLPVVSTASKGGRDVWYDDYNSIIVEPTEDAVWAAVQELKTHPRDPWRIRQAYLDRAAIFRERFKKDVLEPIFRKYSVDADAGEVMQFHPFPWWRLSLASRLKHRLLRR